MEASPPVIFIVDDDEGLLRLISKALKREGFHTESVDSGRKRLNG